MRTDVVLKTGQCLIDASDAVNFLFEVTGLTDSQVGEINAFDNSVDRIEKICEYGSLVYRKVLNKNFAGNILLIDSCMDKILAELLLDDYRNNISDCKILVERVGKNNPLRYDRKRIYEYKFKKFLCALTLGMIPLSEVWDGYDTIEGKYIIVKGNGAIVEYCVYNKWEFEMYLFHHTKFERGSTSKHHFASIYKESDGKMYINLNLQIRFI